MNQLVITESWHKHATARSIPGSVWDSEIKAWTIDLDAADQNALRVLVRLFPEHSHLVDFRRFAHDVPAIDAASSWYARLHDATGCGPPASLIDSPLAGRLYDFQAVDVAYLTTVMRAHGGACLGWDRGLGKTLGALTIAQALAASHTIIVTPNSSKIAVWRDQILKWAPDWWLPQNIHIVDGGKASRSRAVSEYAKDERGILIVHYEALRLVEWGKVPCDLLVVDEAHRLANGGPRGSKVPQFYKSLMKIKSNHRLALTGSIMVNSPEDIFGIAHFCQPKRYASRWRDWNDRFLQYVKGDFGQICVGVHPDQLDSMRDELGTWMVVRHKNDHLDLPAKTEQDLYVDLSRAQRRVYDELVDTFMAELPDGELVIAPSVITQLTKLRQVATGLDLLGESFTDSAKLDLAVDLITGTIPNKTVVFCWHRATVDSLVDRLHKLGIDAEGVTGDTPMKDRARAVEAFQEDPELMVLVATIKTLGESVTLHAAADLIFVESSWVPADMEQAADRIYRIGQDKPVTVTRIIARDTLDEWRIVPTVANKAALKRAILGGS